MSWVLLIQRKGEKMMVKQIDTEVEKKKAVVIMWNWPHTILGARNFSTVPRWKNRWTCLVENEHERAEKSIFLSSILFCSLLLLKLQPEEETGWRTQEGCNVVSVPAPLWYSTLRWKTSQTVLAHHCSNYQQQECPFISITSFLLSSYWTLLLFCVHSHHCPWLLHLYLSSTLSL